MTGTGLTVSPTAARGSRTPSSPNSHRHEGASPSLRHLLPLLAACVLVSLLVAAGPLGSRSSVVEDAVSGGMDTQRRQQFEQRVSGRKGLFPSAGNLMCPNKASPSCHFALPPISLRSPCGGQLNDPSPPRNKSSGLGRPQRSAMRKAWPAVLEWQWSAVPTRVIQLYRLGQLTCCRP